MNDLLLVCSAISLWFALGYPVARTLGPHILSPALAAPPLGLAIHATLTTILYVSGLHLSTAYLLSAGLAIPGIVFGVRDRLFGGWGRFEFAFVATLLFAILLILLPKWIGPPEFSVFQGNVGDQFSYLSTAFMASHYDYAMLNQGGLLLPYPSLTTRPSVILVLGSFASILHQPVLVLSYAYLGALQICILFAATFVLRNLFRLPTAVVLLVALGLTVGFFAQYTFDINAWSHLASVSLFVLYVGLFLLGLLTDRSVRPNDGVLSAGGFFWSMLVCATGFLYVYPESLPIAAAVSIPMLICQFLVSSTRSYVFQRLLLFGLASVIAIALCTFAWQLTIETFLNQSRWLVDTASIGGPLGQTDLWQYFQAYFFGYDNDPKTAFDFQAFLDHSLMRFLYRLLSIYTSFLAGAFGVYFLQPDTSISLFALLTIGVLAILTCILAFGFRGLLLGKSKWVDFNFLAGGLGLLLVLAPLWFGLYVATEKSAISIVLPVRIMWKLVLGASLTCIIIFWIHYLLRRSSSRPAVDRILFVGVVGGFGLLGWLVLSGQYWAAGKGLIMLSPVLFLSIVGPVLGGEEKWKMIKIVVLMYVGTQIGFGAYRSYAAAHDDFGVHYGAPYPVTPLPKRLYRWDYGALRNELTGCSRVHVALEGQLEIFVEMALIDAGINWSSQRLAPNNLASTLTQIEKPDCIVTTEVRDIQPGYKIIWVRRDDRVVRFYRGETNRLDLLPNVPLELETEGLASEEARIVGLAWTNGHAVIRVPNNPRAAPIRRLSLAVSPERLPPDIRVAVIINGRRILDEVATRGPVWTDWTRTIELPNFGEEAWLSIEVDSDTYVFPNDTRTLGARLHLLSLER